jgi:DNA-binding MarR family transcriptional regulator
MGQEQLIDQLDVSKPAISRALASLERKGFVARRRDPEDKRAYRVYLTEEALKIGPDVEHIYNEVFTLAMRDISQDELDYFMELFNRISENFAREQTKKSGED